MRLYEWYKNVLVSDIWSGENVWDGEDTGYYNARKSKIDWLRLSSVHASLPPHIGLVVHIHIDSLLG